MKLKRIFLLSVLAISFTACHSFTVGGKSRDERLKNTNGNSWGSPVMHPVTWGFNGIARDCGDLCKPAESTAQK